MIVCIDSCWELDPSRGVQRHDPTSGLLREFSTWLDNCKRVSHITHARKVCVRMRVSTLAVFVRMFNNKSSSPGRFLASNTESLSYSTGEMGKGTL